MRATAEAPLSHGRTALDRYFRLKHEVTWGSLARRTDGSSLQLFRLALAQGISIAPGPIFSASGRFGNCIRLNYGTPMDKVQLAAMQTLGNLVHELA